MKISEFLAEAVLTSIHNLCFEQRYENIRIFYKKKIIFFVIKFSVYLNRHVFVMLSEKCLVCVSDTV